MSFSTHARCDWCEEVLIADDEEDLVESGWMVVRFGDQSVDFCSLPCVTKWSGSDAAVRMVAHSTSSEDDDA